MLIEYNIDVIYDIPKCQSDQVAGASGGNTDERSKYRVRGWIKGLPLQFLPQFDVRLVIAVRSPFILVLFFDDFVFPHAHNLFIGG